ncbi:MAG: periplasmic heavy metal sensor [Acidobacteria bacterium]|nr:periplasmic heavy metal sensor [Acidobacteriota bacterium]MBU4308074.1 periplasmic heavy metal sensor [Acidobacteriota bacterium]MCG2812293.1 periplasmic heavy metal sensor [Candidatus Aminicenantes bacterium]
MKNRLMIILLVASLGINIGFLLHWFWPKIVPGATARTPSGWHASPIKHHLGLSSKQARLMENERRQVLAQAKPLQEALRQKRRELFVLLKGKDIHDADLDVILHEISRLQAGIEKVFILHSLKARSVFSPAQLRKYEGFLERGLCPGLMSEAACPPGQTAFRGKPGNGCAGMKDEKK